MLRIFKSFNIHKAFYFGTETHFRSWVVLEVKQWQMWTDEGIKRSVLLTLTAEANGEKWPNGQNCRVWFLSAYLPPHTFHYGQTSDNCCFHLCFISWMLLIKCKRISKRNMQQLVINHKAINPRLRSACQNDLIKEQSSFFITVVITSLHSIMTRRQPAYRHRHKPFGNETHGTPPWGTTETRASAFPRQKLTDASRSERSAPSAPRGPDAEIRRQYVQTVAQHKHKLSVCGCI